jgi:hypothetical protein
MRKGLRITALIIALLSTLALSGIVGASSSEKEALPDINYLISVSSMTSGGWKWPPIGGPVQRYVKDISSGKTYLIQVDYWGSARVLGEF